MVGAPVCVRLHPLQRGRKEGKEKERGEGGGRGRNEREGHKSREEGKA